MGWDGYLKNEIVRAIRKELERSNEMADEVWLTEKQLVEEMPFFKKKWIKKKGTNFIRDILGSQTRKVSIIVQRNTIQRMQS